MWNKMDCIKIVRAMLGYGLIEAKGIVDRFFEVHSITSDISSLTNALSFMRYLKAFKDDKFEVTSGGFVVYKRPANVSSEDIWKVSSNWTV